MKHKILSIILFLAVVLSGVFLLPSQAAAPLSEGHYSYSVINGEAKITAVNTSISGDITIPSELGGYPVTSIGNQAFFWCSKITSIIIPDSVITIEPLAFHNCTGLTSITISDSVTSIGASAFYNCSNLISITIPDSVTNLEGSVFYECASLQSVVIGNGVTSIGTGTFFDCRNLTSVTLGNSVTEIGTNAFWYCTALNDITIPDGVTTIGSGAFIGCSSITKINLPESVTFIDESAFNGCSKLEKIEIPDSVTNIGIAAFSGCSSLTSATIGSGVTSIENWAFDNCYNLKEIVFEGDAPIVSDTAFYNVSATIYYPEGNPTWTEDVKKKFGSNISWVAKSDVPEGLQYSISDNQVTITGYTGNVAELNIPATIEGYPVTTIGDSAFYSCHSLTSITIPNSVTSIGNYAFDNCGRLTSVYISDIAAWCNIDFVNMSSNPLMTAKNLYLNGELVTELVIPDGVTGIGQYAFIYCRSLTSITIPDSVISIGYNAFRSCYFLTKVTMQNGVTNIGGMAFSGCYRMTSITIPDSVTSIGNSAFNSCEDLTSVTIPDSVTNIGHSAFAFCSLTHVAFAGTESQWNSMSIDDGNESLTNATRHYNTRLEDIDNCVETGVYCPVCETYILHTAKEGGAHTHGQWVTVKPATFTTEGLQEKTCIVCGGDPITEVIPVLVGKVSKWNVALADDLLVNFYLTITGSIENTAKVRIYVGENAYTFPVSSLERTEDGLYVAQVSTAAAQMNDHIIVMVMNGKEIGSTAVYTVREYCDTILADETHSKYHALVKEMLHYGAMAQLYFGYDVENLANDGITGVANENVPENAEEIAVNDNLNSLDFHGASLVYRDRIAVRYYFTGDMSGLTVTANGITFVPTAKEDMYYVEIADILPQDLNEQITLTVTDAEGNILTVTYGPMNYIVRMNQKDNDSLNNLLKALYNYHLAAKALNV